MKFSAQKILLYLSKCHLLMLSPSSLNLRVFVTRARQFSHFGPTDWKCQYITRLSVWYVRSSRGPDGFICFHLSNWRDVIFHFLVGGCTIGCTACVQDRAHTQRRQCCQPWDFIPINLGIFWRGWHIFGISFSKIRPWDFWGIFHDK